MKKVMYHIHRLDNHDENWIVGNVIDNRKNYTSNLYNRGMKCTVLEDLNDIPTRFDVIIDSYLKGMEAGKLYSTGLIMRLLDHSKVHIHESCLSKREFVLEQVRQQYYPEKISRSNCIWVCSKKALQGWVNQLSGQGDIKIFKVLVDGKLFGSCNSLLPNMGDSYEEQIKKAHQYWNPGKLTGRKDIEYLFEGKLTILEEFSRKKINKQPKPEEQYICELVRDKVPEKIETNKEVSVVRTLTDEEYKRELHTKIFEEARKLNDTNDRKEILKECAELLEVIKNIVELEGYTSDDLEQENNNQKELYGGYDKRIYLQKKYKDKEEQ